MREKVYGIFCNLENALDSLEEEDLNYYEAVELEELIAKAQSILENN